MAALSMAFARKSAANFDILRQIAGMSGRANASGKNVTAKTAIQVSTVFACCRAIGNGMAQVPLKLMRESKDGKTRLPAKDHPLYNLLYLRPNDWQTSFEFRQMLSWHVELAGQAFAFINRNYRGVITELIPFEFGAVRVKRDPDWTLKYSVTAPDGSVRDFPAQAIWHIRGPSLDGWNGIEAIKVAREAIGLAMATEEAVGRLHSNGVRPSGVYSVEGSLNPKQYEDLSKWIHEKIGGAENFGKPMILDRAAKWVSTAMTGVDAQSNETRARQIEEICRFFGVMPIMVGYSDKAATYASAEQMFLAHTLHCLSPRWTAYEQSIDVNLLTEEERKSGLYSNFFEEGMIRGSVKDTKDAILGYVNGGLMTPNEGRAKLDLNPDADPKSDELRIPANITGTAQDQTSNGDGTDSSGQSNAGKSA